MGAGDAVVSESGSERDPAIPCIVEIPGHPSTVPLVLEMPLLDGDPDRIRPERAEAHPLGVPDARIDDTVTPDISQSSGKRSTGNVGVLIEHCVAVWCRQGTNAVELV